VEVFELLAHAFHVFGLGDEAVVFGGGFADGFFQLFGLPRLAEKFENVPLVDGGDDGVDVGVAGEQHAHRLGMAQADLVEKFHAGEQRHALVGHDDVDFVVLEELHALSARARLEDLELAAQQVMHRIADILLVIDHQERVFVGESHASSRGDG